MRKIWIKIMLLCLFMPLVTGCQKESAEADSKYTRHSESFFDVFDTLTQVIGFTQTEEEFNGHVEKIHARLQELHKLYDIYVNYEGINNMKTINDNAGIQPVEVDQEIIDLLLFSKEWYEKTDGKMNIAMGPVLRIWHQYREAGKSDPQNAEIPSMEKLTEAATYTDINKVIIDTENNTVFLEDERMSLDVGSVAKGFATEIVAQEMVAEGFTSGVISPGGNVRVLEQPKDGVRERWGVGIQNPDMAIKTDEDNHLDTVFVNNASVVSSGDYQRFYVVDGKTMHHLIDPHTLMPGEHFRAVTVVTEDSGVADAISTAVFLLPFAEGKALVESMDGIEAMWVLLDGTVKSTEGMNKLLRSQGASSGANQS